jgi:hypothetical protein
MHSSKVTDMNFLSNKFVIKYDFYLSICINYIHRFNVFTCIRYLWGGVGMVACAKHKSFSVDLFSSDEKYYNCWLAECSCVCSSLVRLGLCAGLVRLSSVLQTCSLFLLMFNKVFSANEGLCKWFY